VTRELQIPKHRAIAIEDALARVEAREHPRVTAQSIEDRIIDVSYLRHNHLVICVVEMANGFMVVGKAAPADPRNFDEQVGQRYAYDDAVRQLWPLEGYLLCERLTGG
jgi:hypothetical protein